MIKFLFSILSSKNPNVFALKMTIILCILYLLYLFFKKKIDYQPKEAFTQKEKFILKTNEEIYDDFYSKIHEEIHRPQHRVGYELSNIIKTTQPTRNSVFLDVGSGTGNTVNELREAGYRAYGIDKSHAMINVAEKKFPDCEYKCGNVMEPMIFERDTFTHILCSYYTIYQFEDKMTFLSNCHHWLMPNGYLILHLVNPLKYDTIAPIGKLKLGMNPHDFEKSRITDTIVEFPDFQYKSAYDFSKIKSNVVNITETFRDKTTSNIRQNTQTLYMEDINSIVKKVNEIGFASIGKFDMKDCIDDENQYIYIFEKI